MTWPCIMLDRRVDAAQLHGQMRLGQTAVGAGALQRGAGVGKFAKSVDGDARHRPLMRRGAETSSVWGRLLIAIVLLPVNIRDGARLVLASWCAGGVACPVRNC